MKYSHTGILYKKENEQNIAFCTNMVDSVLQNWRDEYKAKKLCNVQIHRSQV